MLDRNGGARCEFVILGGGVVGVTTAYQLQRDGHEVEILERNGLTAAETSWGNAGMIAPGHTFVWSSPKAPGILLKSLLLRDQALRFRLSLDPRLYVWSWKFLMECTSGKARRNTLLKHRLAAYSQRVLDEVVKAEALEYDRNQRGILYFHRSQQSLDAGIEQMRLLETDGQKIELLDRRAIAALDPNLNSETIVGGILCPTDETGDPAKFTRALAAKVSERGGNVRTGVTILGIETDGDRVTGIATDKGVVTADAYVVALGSESPLITRKIGLDAADLSDQGLFADHPDRKSPETSRDRHRSTSTIWSPSPVSATDCESPRLRNSPATTPATNPATSPS